MSRVIFRSVTVILCALVLIAATPGSIPQAVPTGFTDQLLASVGSPTDIAFTSTGLLLITTQGGQLRVYDGNTLLNTPALNLASTLCNNSERGLLGVTADPQFASNRYIYLYYTFKKHNSCSTRTPASDPVNRVSRFVLGNNNLVNPASELVLIDNIPSPNGNHNAGDLAFGADGYLYISTGDGGCDYNAGELNECAGNNDAARDKHVLLGKILRITRDGAIPLDNPFRNEGLRCAASGLGTPDTHCQETFAWGLRNPFRFAFDPAAAQTRFYINDVGQGAWEEINPGQAGADYGWNIHEGCHNGAESDCGAAPNGRVNPLYAYPHSTGCRSITGGAFIPAGLWPSAYDGRYLFADYVCGRMFTLEPAGNGFQRVEFASQLGTPITMLFGPYQNSQALYYTTYANGGQVRRVVYTGSANRSPVARATADPISGANAPLSVTFDASTSTDADSDPLSFEWDFGDGNSGNGAIVEHTYTEIGAYTAILTVRDDQGASAEPLSIRIDVGNTAPEPQILAPDSNLRYGVGQTITLLGAAQDSEDGALPDSALNWRVLLHHDQHTHPFLGPVSGNQISFAAPAPEDLAATTTSYLEIELTATDSRGLSATTRIEIRPQLVQVTLNSQPSGLQLTINGEQFVTPHTLTSWPGYVLNLDAVAQFDGSQWRLLTGWNDDPNGARSIVTPSSSSSSFNAVFEPADVVFVPRLYQR